MSLSELHHTCHEEDVVVLPLSVIQTADLGIVRKARGVDVGEGEGGHQMVVPHRDQDKGTSWKKEQEINYLSVQLE